MQSKVIIFITLVALVVGDIPKKKTATPDGAKNKRGLIEFGYGYGLNSVPEYEYYAYPPYSAALTPAVHSVVTKNVALPVVQQSSIPIPTVEKYVKVPSYTTINRIHYPVEVPKTQPIALKLAQPYVLSYVKQPIPQVSTFNAPSPTPSPIVYEQYTNLNQYSSW